MNGEEKHPPDGAGESSETDRTVDFTGPIDNDGATVANGATSATGAMGATGAFESGAGSRERASIVPAETPRQIGEYAVVRMLGAGGMGVVYVATDPRLQRNIALKVLPSQLSLDTEAYERFRGEARLLAQINHPNIATIYSLEQSGDDHFLTMEFIHGQTLAEWMTPARAQEGQWLGVCRQIATALEAAHRSGIVHLDLKPLNVMVTEDGLVKVLDFGLAMALGREHAAGDGEVRTLARAQREISGTPGYMSPEQLRGDVLDARADIWAFGCILYECLTGSPVIPGKTLRDRIQATLRLDLDLERLPTTTPAAVRDLVARCLAVQVDERLPSITKARQILEEALAARSLPARPRTQEATPNNLPVLISSFVGRQRQKTEVEDRLSKDRLVTLTGVGGGGKTRLAIEVGRSLLADYPEGIWLVELAPLSDPSLVAQEIASALGLRDHSSRSVRDAVFEHLGERRALLILDNCEHLVDAVAEFATALLQRSTHLRILATSREVLGVTGESTFQVPSLSLPRSMKTPALPRLRAAEAVQLFLERARSVSPSFEVDESNADAVFQICRRLDGIPLALELAAARVRVLAPAEIAKRLDSRFRLLSSTSRDVMPRHKTLQALIDWSYDHLTEPEQTLLRRLSLFAGGWTLEAAEAVCAGEPIEEWEVLDLISLLVDKSMVELDADAGQETGRVRYRMLETIREYAREKVSAAGEGAAVLERHREYFLAFAEEAEPQLMGREQSSWLTRLALDHDNLRLAIDLCCVPGADPDHGHRLAGALGRYFFMRGHWNEGRAVFAQLFSENHPRATAAGANALNWAGNLAKLQGDYGEAGAFLKESLQIRRELGETAGIAASLSNLANVIKDQGDYARASELYREALDLHRETGNQAGLALALHCLGLVADLREDRETARERFEESLEIRRRLGNPAAMADTLNNLGSVLETLGDLPSAMERLEEALGIRRELGDQWGAAFVSMNLGLLAKKQGDLRRTREFYDEGLATFRELGDRVSVAGVLMNLGEVSLDLDEYEDAERLYLESLEILRELQDQTVVPKVLRGLARLAWSRASRRPGGMEDRTDRTEHGDPTEHADRTDTSPASGPSGDPLDQGRRAAWLYAASEALRLGQGGHLADGDAARLETARAEIRQFLGADTFEGLWRDASSEELEAILTFALDRPETDGPISAMNPPPP